MAMILLSRLLKYKLNRWANIVVAIESTAFVAFTLIHGKVAPYYLFFSSIEIACTLFIIAYAWTWRQPDNSSVGTLS